MYAYLKSGQSKARLHVPLLNIPKADISLRPELLALLPYANVEREHLITLDDLPGFNNLRENLPPQNTRWILVDHNALQGKLGSLYSERVVGVVDHHADECKVLKDTGSEPRIIETSGSCTSLVVNHFRDAWESSNIVGVSSGAAHAQGDSLAEDSAVVSLWDAQVAQFALASVLIDTHNLKDENKATEHDEQAAAFLEAKINSSPKVSTTYSRDSFFDQISEAKKDVDSIPLDGILRKDYKQWTEDGMAVGISSAVKPLDYLQEKAEKDSRKSPREALIEIATSFAKERSLAVYSIMTAFQAEDGKFSRELLVLGLSKNGSAAVKRFTDSSASQLKLEHVEGTEDDGQRINIWRQHDVAASRKQVAPMIRQAMTG